MQDWKAYLATLALVIAGCGEGDRETNNPFGTTPTATNPTMSGGTSEPGTGGPGSSSGEAPTSGATSGATSGPTSGPTSGATDSTGANSSGMTTAPLTTGVPTSCGDAVVDAGEECDDGNADDTDACTSACMNAKCGDGFVQAGEACDEVLATASCDADCTAAECGDGVVNMAAGEDCDDGNNSDDDGCSNTCTGAKCGDGVVQPGIEECDDANMVDDDGCSNACTIGDCVPSGARAPFDTLAAFTTTGDWQGNPCDDDAYTHGPADTQCFGGFGETFTCSGPSTCVSHVGITTYWSDQICQGIWEVLCDGKLVAQISTMDKVCNTSAKDGPCSVAFAQQVCSTIELRSVQDGMFGAGSCCANGAPDSSVGSISAW